MIIMFIIASTTSVASVAVVSLAAFQIVDSRTRLRSDLLIKRDKAGGWSKRSSAAIIKVFPLPWYGIVNQEPRVFGVLETS